MKMPSFLSKLQKDIVDNSPTILAVIGGVGVIASVILASQASVKVKEDLEEARKQKRAESKEDSEDIDISFGDKAVIYAKAYTPTAIMVVATEACIFGSNHINQKRIAAIGAAYILKEADFKEYKQHVEEVLGEKKAQEIKDSLIQKHINNVPQNDDNTTTTNIPNIPKGMKLDLWWDETSKRYFYTNVEYVRRAEIKANAQLNTDFVSVNDIYNWLGIDTIDLMENDGWDPNEVGEIVLGIGSAIKEPDIIVWTLSMDAKPKVDKEYPSSEWLGIG